MDPVTYIHLPSQATQVALKMMLAYLCSQLAGKGSLSEEIFLKSAPKQLSASCLNIAEFTVHEVLNPLASTPAQDLQMRFNELLPKYWLAGMAANSLTGIHYMDKPKVYRKDVVWVFRKLRKTIPKEEDGVGLNTEMIVAALDVEAEVVLCLNERSSATGRSGMEINFEAIHRLNYQVASLDLCLAFFLTSKQQKLIPQVQQNRDTFAQWAYRHAMHLIATTYYNGFSNGKMLEQYVPEVKGKVPAIIETLLEDEKKFQIVLEEAKKQGRIEKGAEGNEAT